ncbi:MAG: FAD-dependent oxidoreductase [Deltaproteobacteria bacterium]
MSSKELVLAHINDLKNGEMKSYPIGDDRKILLSKIRGQFHAVGAVCTHYGADLDEGVLNGERIVCPWHHAAFNAKTGDVEEPPALDALPTYEVRVEGDDVIVKLPEEFQDSRVPEMADHDPQQDNRTFVIIGAGAAGNAAAQTLRQDGFKGRIVVVTREDRTPYDRPQLSKEYLQGEADEEFIPLRSKEFYQEHGLELMLQTEVKTVEVANRAVLFEGGERLKYDKLLLATGAVPRTLDVPGADLKNVFTLRTYDDSAAIIAASKTASSVAVIGASFIGMETAYSLRERKLPITVIAPEAVPFQKVLGEEIGKLFQDLHEENGVQFKLNARVAKFEGTERVEAVVLEDGQRVKADLVVAGVGVKPAVDYLVDTGLLSEGAVTVDPGQR